MTTTAHEYLVHRFQSDATVLRERVALMARGTTVPGPDAATSSRMADACDEVAAMLLASARDGDASVALEAIMAIVPLLEQRAAEQQANPAVRSVYAGAATRIREVRSAEARSTPGDRTAADDLDEADAFGAAEGHEEDIDSDADDEAIDFDDDELDDDDLDDHGK